MSRYKVYTIEKGLVETNIYDEVHSLTWHREDGPAYYSYDNGNIVHEAYWVNGAQHRLDGPAKVWYSINGSITFTTYWINNIEYTKEQYDKELLKLKVQSL